MKCKMAARSRQCLYKLGLLDEFLRASVIHKCDTSLNLQGQETLTQEEKKIKKIQCLEKIYEK